MTSLSEAFGLFQKADDISKGKIGDSALDKVAHALNGNDPAPKLSISFGGINLGSTSDGHKDMGIEFHAENISGKSGKQVVAHLTQEQADNLAKVSGQISADEQKKLFGSLETKIEPEAGGARLVITNADQMTPKDAYNTAKIHGDAISTALATGDVEAVRGKLASMKVAEGKSESVLAELPIDLQKLADRGLDISMKTAQAAVDLGHGLQGMAVAAAKQVGQIIG